MGAAVFWLVIAICVFAIDILTSNFCFTLFAVGAVVAAVCGVMEVPFIIQIIVFSVLNIISFAVGYRYSRKNLKQQTKEYH